MSANDHLHQRQFHGSASDITDRVLPAEQVGRQMWPGYKTSGGRAAKTVAFATTSESTAWRFAGQAADNMQEMERNRRWEATGHSPDYDRNVVRQRARVYEVAPHPAQEPGLLNAEHRNWKRNSRDGRENLHEYIAPHFDVTGQHDIKPGYQGTFPQLNWNQFHVRGGSATADANHPSWEDVEHGHQGSRMWRVSAAAVYGGDPDDENPYQTQQRRKAEDAEIERKQMKLF